LVIDKQGGVSIIDFGCSASVDKKGQIKGTSKGDRRYMSPERYKLFNKGKRTGFDGVASDSWSIGLILLELATGMVEDKEDILKNNPKEYLSNPFLARATKGSYAALVKGLLAVDPDSRLSVEEAVSKPLFQQETQPEVL